MTIHAINHDAAVKNFRAWLEMASEYTDNIDVDFDVVLIGHADCNKVEVSVFNADMRDLTWAAVTLSDFAYSRRHPSKDEGWGSAS